MFVSLVLSRILPDDHWLHRVILRRMRRAHASRRSMIALMLLSRCAQLASGTPGFGDPRGSQLPASTRRGQACQPLRQGSSAALSMEAVQPCSTAPLAASQKASAAWPSAARPR